MMYTLLNVIKPLRAGAVFLSVFISFSEATPWITENSEDVLKSTNPWRESLLYFLKQDLHTKEIFFPLHTHWYILEIMIRVI